MRDTKEYTIFNSVTPVTITSSTDATPIVITATAHGFATGDLVLIYGHTTNIAANGIFKITRLTADTFSIQDRYTGSNVVGSGAGAGADGICVIAPKIISVQDFKASVLTVITSGTATLTLKVAGSLGKISADSNFHGDTPNFGATQSDINPYDFVQIVNLQSGASVNGNTGIVVAGTDILNTYEVNINYLKYLTVIPVSWTQGSVTIKISLGSDN
jgi:hypothetical protein